MPESTGATNAGAPAQAQTVSAEPEVAAIDPQGLVDEHTGDEVADTAADAGVAGTDAPVQHFEGSVAKISRTGETVLSDHLMPGERLANESTAPDDLDDTRNPGAQALARQAEAAEQAREDARAEATAQGEKGTEQ